MSELIGRTLGPYRITEQLGSGGMATVFKAYQANMDREVAVKVLPRHFAQDPTFVGRFEQEAKVIAKLEHSRILPVYDFGEDDGITYIVMRFLQAGTLAERIRAGEIPLDEVARIITQVGEGLDYAHKKGVIHRDIKPSNIMLDHADDVYITDFGISKVVEGSAQFTGSGIVGTPDYVSPEQAMGQPIDHRSDIYALGIVLYQMATGDVPFHAETPMAVIIKHINDPLPLPHNVNPRIPDAVEKVILKALAKNREDRFQSCAELSKALRAAVGAPVPAAVGDTTQASAHTPAVAMSAPGTMPMSTAAPSATQQVSAPAKRRRWLIPALVVGGLILLAVFAFFILRNFQRNQAARATAVGNVPATQSVSSGVTPGGPQSNYEDHFDGTQLAANWRPVNVSQDNSHMGDGRFALAVQPGTSLIGAGGQPQLSAPAVLLEAPDDQEFVVQAIVDFRPTQNYQAAGLIVTSASNAPIATLVRAYCDRSICQRDAIYFDSWTQYAANPDSYQPAVLADPALMGGPVYLRITRASDRLVGEASADGGTWHRVGEWPLVGDPIGLVGLSTNTGGEQTTPAPAYFDDFVLSVVGPLASTPAGPQPLFAEDFDAPQLRPMWEWINQPGDWGIQDQRLAMRMVSESSILTGERPEDFRLNAPALVIRVPDEARDKRYSVQVDVSITPTQNFQGAGLVLINERRVPMISLLRSYCMSDNPSCIGDGIYMDNWLALALAPGAYRPPSAGANTLPHDGVVTLRLSFEERRVVGDYSLDGGQTWLPVGDWPLRVEERVEYIGLIAHTGKQPSEPIPVVFDNFIIWPPAP